MTTFHKKGTIVLVNVAQFKLNLPQSFHSWSLSISRTRRRRWWEENKWHLNYIYINIYSMKASRKKTKINKWRKKWTLTLASITKTFPLRLEFNRSFQCWSHYGHGQFSIWQHAAEASRHRHHCSWVSGTKASENHVGNQFPSVPGSECLFVPSDTALKPTWCLN